MYIDRSMNAKVGQVEDAVCPRCKEEDETPDHIVFRCQAIKRVRDMEGRGRRQWAAEGDEMGQLGRIGVEEVGAEGEHGASR